MLGCRFAYPAAARGDRCRRAACRCHLVQLLRARCEWRDSPPMRGTGKPCLIGEFSFRGADSGLPNTNGAGPVVATQAERAACFRRYVTAALRRADARRLPLVRACRPAGRGPLRRRELQFRHGHDRGSRLRRPHARDDRAQCRGRRYSHTGGARPQRDRQTETAMTNTDQDRLHRREQHVVRAEHAARHLQQRRAARQHADAGRPQRGDARKDDGARQTTECQSGRRD